VVTLDAPSKEQRLMCAAREALRLLRAHINKDAVEAIQSLAVGDTNGDSGASIAIETISSTVPTGKNNRTKAHKKPYSGPGDISSEQVHCRVAFSDIAY
jgi:hypothetical protein